MHRIKRPQTYLAIFIIAVLECALLNRFRIFGVQPDLTLVFIIFLSLHLDRMEAVESGIIAGLLRDLLTTGPFGTNIFLLGAIALLISHSSEMIYKEFVFTQLFITILAGFFLHAGGLFVKSAISGAELVELGAGLLRVELAALLYTSLISPLAFLVLDRVYRFPQQRMF